MAGGWTRSRSASLGIAGLALPGSVLLAEAGVLVYRSGNQDSAYRTDSLQTAAIEAALGLAIPLVLGRGTRQRVGALGASIPLALAGFGAFVLVGFGG